MVYILQCQDIIAERFNENRDRVISANKETTVVFKYLMKKKIIHLFPFSNTIIGPAMSLRKYLARLRYVTEIN